MNIDQILDKIYRLPDESRIQLIQNLGEVEQPKCSILMKAGKVETSIYFIKEV